MELWHSLKKHIEKDRYNLFEKPYIDINDRINEIVKNVIKLRDKCYPKLNLPINYLTIFSQSKEEKDSLRIELQKLGKESQTNNGYNYKLKHSLKFNDETIGIIRVRIPDIHRKELGCADLSFDSNDYPKLREIAIKNGLDVIIRDQYEMIELSDFNINVYAYLVQPLGHAIRK